MFAWGANSYGQLGTGDQVDRHEPTFISSENDVTHISGGGRHSLFVKGRQLYGCGSNASGQLGQDGPDLLHFTSGITLHNVVRSIACGWDFTLILTADGRLYGMGSNAHNQLCSGGPKILNELTPISVGLLVSVSAGLRHTIAVAENGDVFCWGSNSRGQLGLADRSVIPSVTTPIDLGGYLQDGEKIVDCAAGAYHSVLLTDHGSVILMGELKYFDTSFSRADRYIRLDPSVFSGRPVRKIASGWNHVAALTDTGEIFTLGRSDLGQLGRPTTNSAPQNCSKPGPSFDSLPASVTFPLSKDNEQLQIVQLASGAEHCLALDSRGLLWTWGWNEHGMCGVVGDSQQGNKGDACPCVRTPQLVNFHPHSSLLKSDNLRVTHIGAGHGHSFAVVQ